MSRTWVENAEFGALIMHCVECPDWSTELIPEPQESVLLLGVPVDGVPTWKISHTAGTHVLEAHDGKPS